MLSEDLGKTFVRRTKVIYNQLDDYSGGTLSIMVDAVQRFGETQAAQAAAAMAYYAFFSLFPLLLALISVGSFVLESEEVQQQILTTVTTTIPISQELINQNIQRVLELRGTVGIIGLVGLLWAASGVFNALAFNINQAWTDSESRGFFERRLVALGIVGSLAVLLILSLISTAIFELLPRLPFVNTSLLFQSKLIDILSDFLPIAMRLLIFLGMYRWVPDAQVNWLDAVWGAIVATLGWEFTTIAFTWYVGSGLVQYELIYGSLGTIIGLLFWIYLGNLITLFGAHLSAAVARNRSSKAN